MLRRLLPVFFLCGCYVRGPEWAGSFAERLFARTVQHEKNLVNLTDLQLLTNQVKSAQQTLELLSRYYPYNGRIVRLFKTLEKTETEMMI